MTWVVYALLGVFAVAMGRSISLFQEEKREIAAGNVKVTPGSETEAEPTVGEVAPVETCQKETPFCTMEFRPKTCTVNVNGKRFESSGNNGCQANQALLRTLCAAGVKSLDNTALASLHCAEPAGDAN
ncbi:MAG: hypothetical protein IOD12_00055 [Silvanigrellales bacterium]|nr:hypothetical protein [Silvanigrellales bacterium]